MASSISGLSSSLNPLKSSHPTPSQFPLTKHSISFRSQTHSSKAQSVAREVPASLSKVNVLKSSDLGLEKDPKALWKRYVDWLYQHKELGLFLDVSRVGFTDEFFEEMEPRFQSAFKAMEELDKGAIANPDEGRMVGHYWLRNPKLAPNSFLRLQIENTLEAVCKFAEEVVGGKVRVLIRLYV